MIPTRLLITVGICVVYLGKEIKNEKFRILRNQKLFKQQIIKVEISHIANDKYTTAD